MNRREIIAAGLAALSAPLAVVSDSVVQAGQSHDAEIIASRVRSLASLIRELDRMADQYARKTESSRQAEFQRDFKLKLQQLRQEMERLFPGVAQYVRSQNSGDH